MDSSNLPHPPPLFLHLLLDSYHCCWPDGRGFLSGDSALLFIQGTKAHWMLWGWWIKSYSYIFQQQYWTYMGDWMVIFIYKTFLVVTWNFCKYEIFLRSTESPALDFQPFFARIPHSDKLECSVNKLTVLPEVDWFGIETYHLFKCRTSMYTLFIQFEWNPGVFLLLSMLLFASVHASNHSAMAYGC